MVGVASPSFEVFTSFEAYEAGDLPLLVIDISAGVHSLSGLVVPNNAYYRTTGLFNGELVTVVCAAIPVEDQLATWELAPVGAEGDVLTLVGGAWLPQAPTGENFSAYELLAEFERGLEARDS